MRKLVTTAVALSAIVFTSSAFAADDWKSQWSKIEAAAEQEGELVFQSMPNQAFRHLIQTEWPKAYPKITLSVSALPSRQFWARIRTEREAGKYLWDMSVSGASTGYILAKDGIVDPILPELVNPELRDPGLWGGWDQAFFDTKKKYVLSLVAYVASPWFNTDKISPAKVAKEGFKLLLDPEYKGKIAWHDPTIPGGGRNYIQPFRDALGDDGLKTLVQEQANIVAGQHMVVEEMARGVAWIGIGPPVRSLIRKYEKAGIKIDLATFGRTPKVAVLSTSGATAFVFNKRPHPNATRVFLNWLLSRDMQYKMAKATDQRSRRQDVPETAEKDSIPIKGAKYFAPQREENLKLQNKNMALVRELRKGAH